MGIVSIGYDDQGKGAYIDSLDRYSEKSKGLYLAVSKSFRLIGTFALHGGLNYSFERDDGDKDLNGYIGMEKSINEELGLFKGNIVQLTELGEFMGRTTVFIAKIKDKDMFGEPHFETEETKWLTAEEFQKIGRDLHKPVVKAAVRKIEKLER